MRGCMRCLNVFRKILGFIFTSILGNIRCKFYLKLLVDMVRPLRFGSVPFPFMQDSKEFVMAITGPNWECNLMPPPWSALLNSCHQNMEIMTVLPLSKWYCSGEMSCSKESHQAFLRRKKRERVCLRTGSRKTVVVVVFLQLFLLKKVRLCPTEGGFWTVGGKDLPNKVSTIAPVLEDFLQGAHDESQMDFDPQSCVLCDFSFGPHLTKKWPVGSVPVSGLDQQLGIAGKDPLCSHYHLVLALPSR